MSARRSPSRRRAALLLGLAAAFLPAPCAAAYELNPLKDRDAGGTKPPAWVRNVDTVHEDITHAALACAAARQAADAAGDQQLCSPTLRARSHGDPGNIASAIIVGLWWNDDPNHLAYARLLVPAAVQYLEMKETARRVRTAGFDAAGRRTRNLLFRSHYGDLQFLHGMATADHESPAASRQKILDWLEFTYGVATGAVAPATLLRDLDHPVALLFDDRRHPTVGALFRNRRSMAHLPVDQLALGSMLHLIQDSFAAGHAHRVQAPSPMCPAGRVAQFHSYLHQAGRDHLVEDKRQAYRFDSSRSASNPVDASARIILMARDRADWSAVVEPYLRRNLFCLEGDAAPGGPGRFGPPVQIATERRRPAPVALSYNLGRAGPASARQGPDR